MGFKRSVNRSIKPSSHVPENSLIKTPEGYERQLNKKLSIRFDHLLPKKCDFNSLRNADYKQVITFMSEVCLHPSIEAYKNHTSRTIDRVEDRNHYSWLFSGLSEEIEIWEIRLTGTARCFFFVDADKALQIRAIQSAHLETNKNKR